MVRKRGRSKLRFALDVADHHPVGVRVVSNPFSPRSDAEIRQLWQIFSQSTPPESHFIPRCAGTAMGHSFENSPR